MNENLPPPFPGAPTPLPELPKVDATPIRLSRILFGLAIAVASFDVCFWNIQSWGFSVAVFFLILTGVILANRERSNRSGKISLLLALFAGALLAATIETGVTNTFVLLALTLAIAGETYFREIISSWGRWISQGVALLCAPGRIFWLAGAVLEAAFSKGVGGMGTFVGGCLLTLPALFLALIFGSLLASGNMVFGSWTDSFFKWLEKELELYLDPARIFMWLGVAFVVLPLLRPANVSPRWWKSVQEIPRLPEIIPTRAALFCSGLILIVLNLLFLVANYADALFLWTDHAMPSGVEYKAYVHEGVNALIFTVILSALVLTIIFQQGMKVVEHRGLKFLAYAWVVQNLFLIFTVSEKLRFYIIYYEMTVARLSTLIFLALVLIGFVLLTIKIARDRSITWLIGGCILATFATFYVTQFMDLAGWSANYNVSRMEKERWYRFDTATMCPWGPAVWPALSRAHELAPDDQDITKAWFATLHGPDYANTAGRDWQHWREFSLRAWMNRGALSGKTP